MSRNIEKEKSKVEYSKLYHELKSFNKALEELRETMELGFSNVNQQLDKIEKKVSQREQTELNITIVQ